MIGTQMNADLQDFFKLKEFPAFLNWLGTSRREKRSGDKVLI
jgi:hypothetical protein